VNKYKFISWNINSIRKREEHIKKLLSAENPDFLLLQEVKATEEQLPYFEDYNIYHSLEKGKNGVAIITKHQCEYFNFLNYPGRLVAINFQNIVILSLYMYNGFSLSSPKEKKMQMFEWMTDMFSKSNKPIIIGGDFNILYKHNDCSNLENPYDDDEISIYKNWESSMIDTFPKGGMITWWDYRGGAVYKNQGFGLDKFYTTLSSDFSTPKVLMQYRTLPGPSDHAPISINFDQW